MHIVAPASKKMRMRTSSLLQWPLYRHAHCGIICHAQCCTAWCNAMRVILSTDEVTYMLRHWQIYRRACLGTCRQIYMQALTPPCYLLCVLRHRQTIGRITHTLADGDGYLSKHTAVCIMAQTSIMPCALKANVLLRANFLKAMA